jgi:hypothetical protein
MTEIHARKPNPKLEVFMQFMSDEFKRGVTDLLRHKYSEACDRYGDAIMAFHSCFGLLATYTPNEEERALYERWILIEKTFDLLLQT